MGQLIVCSCRYLPSCGDVFEAELMAIMEGIQVATQHTPQPMIIQTDSTKGVLTLTNKMLDRSYLSHFMEELKNVVMGDQELELVKINRTQNGLLISWLNLRGNI